MTTTVDRIDPYQHLRPEFDQRVFLLLDREGPLDPPTVARELTASLPGVRLALRRLVASGRVVRHSRRDGRWRYAPRRASHDPGPARLTETQLATLVGLRDLGGGTVTEVARRSGLAPSTVYDRLAALHRLGLVTWEHAPVPFWHRGRVRLWRLADDGGQPLW